MPYINQQQREKLKRWYIHDPIPAGNAGELNYLITLEIMDYLQTHGKTYQTMNDILGALEGAKQEFYRRVVIPYEEQKRIVNHDVY